MPPVSPQTHVEQTHASSYRHLEDGAVYPVRVSEGLATLQHQVETALRQQCQDVPALIF